MKRGVQGISFCSHFEATRIFDLHAARKRGASQLDSENEGSPS